MPQCPDPQGCRFGNVDRHGSPVGSVIPLTFHARTNALGFVDHELQLQLSPGDKLRTLRRPGLVLQSARCQVGSIRAQGAASSNCRDISYDTVSASFSPARLIGIRGRPVAPSVLQRAHAGWDDVVQSGYHRQPLLNAGAKSTGGPDHETARFPHCILKSGHRSADVVAERKNLAAQLRALQRPAREAKKEVTVLVRNRRSSAIPASFGYRRDRKMPGLVGPPEVEDDWTLPAVACNEGGLPCRPHSVSLVVTARFPSISLSATYEGIMEWTDSFRGRPSYQSTPSRSGLACAARTLGRWPC